MAFCAGVSVLCNEPSKRHLNHSKTTLTVLGLDHPFSGAQMISCTTEPSWLLGCRNDGIYSTFLLGPLQSRGRHCGVTATSHKQTTSTVTSASRPRHGRVTAADHVIHVDSHGCRSRRQSRLDLAPAAAETSETAEANRGASASEASEAPDATAASEQI